MAYNSIRRICSKLEAGDMNTPTSQRNTTYDWKCDRDITDADAKAAIRSLSEHGKQVVIIRKLFNQVDCGDFQVGKIKKI